VLKLFCAGAAQGLVATVSPRFEAETGAVIDGSFGAVGALREKIEAGESCDVIVLTAALIATLEREGRIVAGTSAPLGRVRTGIAVREGESLPDIRDGIALSGALVAARGIYVPDPQRATAGIHFVGVLKRLAIYADVGPQLRPYPNGAAAMQALARSSERDQIGCTQVSEILYTQGITLVGALPAGFELATVYSAAVSATAREPALPRRFIGLLAGPALRDVRAAAGFDV
jgi:molybdate transport system substrate-binding protein